MNVYTIHLSTEKRLTLQTNTDLAAQLRDFPTDWIDAGPLGLLNPAHIVRVEPLT